MVDDTTKFSDESIVPQESDARAVAQYWFTEAEETLTVADHLIEKEMVGIREVLAWLKSHRTS